MFLYLCKQLANVDYFLICCKITLDVNARGGLFAYCNFSETYLPDVNGVATHVKILAEGLKKLGHEVLVVTADASAKEIILIKVS